VTQKTFYIDSCIWLNLFKKEENPHKGSPFWKSANDFITRVIISKDCEIAYSSIILQELRAVIKNDRLFERRADFIKRGQNFRRVEISSEDYLSAKEIEKTSGPYVGFGDCLHIAICKRLALVLVTRDREMINVAKRYVKVGRPEDLSTQTIDLI